MSAPQPPADDLRAEFDAALPALAEELGTSPAAGMSGESSSGPRKTGRRPRVGRGAPSRPRRARSNRTGGSRDEGRRAAALAAPRRGLGAREGGTVPERVLEIDGVVVPPVVQQALAYLQRNGTAAERQDYRVEVMEAAARVEMAIATRRLPHGVRGLS